MIVATAGHVDHGKTTLVKAITGIDTDRLVEEKRRGLTIEPGFAHWRAPGGSSISFVDVPGHERFIRNMLAGLSAVDFALMVVAADDGVMPQTREHLAVLDLLEISRGCIVITKIDRVSPQRLESVTADVLSLVSSTTMAGIPAVPVSAVDARGIDALIRLLDEAARLTTHSDSATLFRMAIDREFALKGIGRVVTGTTVSGTVGVGDSLTIAPGGPPVRVRAVHVNGVAARQAGPRQRCALALAGLDSTAVGSLRGAWLTVPDNDQPVKNADLWCRLLASEDRPLRHWTAVHVHHGAGHVTARAAVLGQAAIAPGDAGFIQLVLDRPLHVKQGDAVILRDAAARRTIGGGHIVDPFGPVKGRGCRDRVRLLGQLRGASRQGALGALLKAADNGVDLHVFRQSRNLAAEAMDELVDRTSCRRFTSGEEDIAMSHACFRASLDTIVARLAEAHDKSPARIGVSERDIWRKLKPARPLAVWKGAIAQLIQEVRLVVHGGLLRLPSHSPHLTAAEAEIWSALRGLLEAAGNHPPAVPDAASALEIPSAAVFGVLRQAAALGHVEQIGRNRFILADTARQLALAATALAKQSPDGEFTTVTFARHAGVGRNVAVEVLEHFDRLGLTVRCSSSSRKLAATETAEP